MDDEKIAQSVHPELTDKTESEPKVTITREQLIEAVKSSILNPIPGHIDSIAHSIATKLGL